MTVSGALTTAKAANRPPRCQAVACLGATATRSPSIGPRKAVDRITVGALTIGPRWFPPINERRGRAPHKSQDRESFGPCDPQDQRQSRSWPAIRRGSASHSCDKVNRNILTIKSAAFLKKIGNGPGQFVYKLIDSLCFAIEPRKATGFNVPKINLRIVSDINGDRRFHHLGMLLPRAHTGSKINVPNEAALCRELGSFGTCDRHAP
jgi:hypothetical protein